MCGLSQYYLKDSIKKLERNPDPLKLGILKQKLDYVNFRCTFDENTLNCIDIVKYLKLNYQCVESSEYKTQIKNIFLVEKNFKFYYLKIRRNITLYELAVEKSLKDENVVIPLFYHKVVHNLFLGIYGYKPNLGTLEDLIKQNNLTVFDRYLYMKSITQLVLLTLQNRNPRNYMFKLNLEINNILVLKNIPYGVSLINVFNYGSFSDLLERDFRNNSIDGSLDIRNLNILALGRIFHVICFGIGEEDLLENEIIQNLSEYSKKNHEYQIDPQIIKMIRIMLNQNPIDRPSFEVILNTLEHVIYSYEFLFEKKMEELNYYYFNMRHELEVEYFTSSFRDVDHDNSLIQDENYSEFILKIKSKYPNVEKLKHSEIIKNIPKVKIEEMINNIKDFAIKNDLNQNENFGMINDMTRGDFEIFDLKKINYQKIAQQVIPENFYNDFEDLKYMSQEILNPFFQDGDLNDKFLYYDEKYQLYIFSDRFDLKRFDLKVNTIDVYFLFLINELNKNYSEKIELTNNNFQTNKNNKSKWNFLLRIPNTYLFLMIGCQLLTFIFGVIFFVKNTGLEKYSKTEFSTYITF